MSCVPGLNFQFICLCTCIQFDLKWTVDDVAEEGHPGGTLRQTVKFSCVLHLPFAQSNLYVMDLLLVKSWQVLFQGKNAADIYGNLLFL